jgi:hypothetical protein
MGHATLDTEMEQRTLAAAAAAEESDSDISWSSMTLMRLPGGEGGGAESNSRVLRDAQGRRRDWSSACKWTRRRIEP